MKVLRTKLVISTVALLVFAVIGATYVFSRSHRVPDTAGISLDSILVTFEPNARPEQIDSVAQHIKGTVMLTDSQSNTIVFKIPARKDLPELMQLLSDTEHLSGVKYTTPSMGDPPELRGR